MLGYKGLVLAKELSQNTTDLLSPYNEAAVKSVIQEVNTCNEDNQKCLSQNDPNEYTMNCVHVRHSAMMFNRRCLIAYHYERLLALKKFRWQYGRELPKSIQANLSQDELAWFKKYCGNLTVYMGHLNEGRGLDLTLRLKPPKGLCIRVRCLIDYGDYELDDGTIVVLSLGSTHFLQQAQCEKLIQQAVLEQIPS